MVIARMMKCLLPSQDALWMRDQKRKGCEPFGCNIRNNGDETWMIPRMRYLGMLKRADGMSINGNWESGDVPPRAPIGAISRRYREKRSSDDG